ncbi:MAG: arginine--tRNA ligase [Anaerolineales bacterium]|nr:arginine--tRNA ligase [Anaerolineales bacterium]
MFNNELNQTADSILAAIKVISPDFSSSVEWQPIPFKGQWGYGTTACFQAAASEARGGRKINVPARAQEIAEKVLTAIGTPPGFDRVEVERGYLNLFFEPGHYAARVLDEILDHGSSYGQGQPINERVMIEYSQPNTHKAFHVGHLRNVILGGAMANIFSFAGFDTVRANYIGDIGWHVIQWMWCYLKFHAGEEPTGDHTRWMASIYSEAVRLVDENPDYEQEARAVFSRWDEKDPDIIALWEKTRQWSLDGFAEIYQILGEHFDVYFFESEVEEPGKVLVDDLIERGIAVDERPEGGPVVVKLDEILKQKKEKYRVLVMLRSDGTSLYATKDLPLAIKKFEEWNVDRSIYVIDVRQSLYLQQVFKLLEIIGFKQANKCFHLSYEIVNLPGNVTISSREGAVVLFDDLITEAFSRAAAIVEEKNPDLDTETKENVARKVALGAIKYPMLSVDNNKVATFDWEKALDFEGQAAPYIQYAHVRASSILSRVKTLPESLIPDYDLEQAEIVLLDRLSRFPEEIQRAARDYKPLIIANFVYELARDFTSFYQNCPVLKAEGAQRDVRLRLTAAARQVLKNALSLLGITAPDVM